MCPPDEKRGAQKKYTFYSTPIHDEGKRVNVFYISAAYLAHLPADFKKTCNCPKSMYLPVPVGI